VSSKFNSVKLFHSGALPGRSPLLRHPSHDGPAASNITDFGHRNYFSSAKKKSGGREIAFGVKNELAAVVSCVLGRVLPFRCCWFSGSTLPFIDSLCQKCW
jgi:hypothetical protein